MSVTMVTNTLLGSNASLHIKAVLNECVYTNDMCGFVLM